MSLHQIPGTSEVLGTWVVDKALGCAGPCRDEQGRPLSGFRIRETAGTRTVTVLANGHSERDYRFPKDALAPAHAMLRWLNTPMCGMALRDPQGRRFAAEASILEAVLAGAKPVGDLYFKNEQDQQRDQALAQSRAKGLDVLCYTRPHNADSASFVMIGQPVALQDLFDLDAVASFYERHAALSGDVRRDLRSVGGVHPVQALQLYPWASPSSAIELILTGLCLGYSMQSTLAILLEG